MTIGIYKLNFTGTDKVYIGQSEISVEGRFKDHLYNLRTGNTSAKMNEAFMKFGLPTMELLIACEVKQLDFLEEEYIKKFNSVDNGFNTCRSACGKGGVWGEVHGMSIHTNEQVALALKNMLKYPNLSYKSIAKVIGVTHTLITDISSGTKHKWLEIAFPAEYAALMKLPNRTTGPKLLQCYYVISPEIVVYKISNIRAFATEHMLDNAALGRVLHGKAKTHKGWKLCPANLQGLGPNI